MSSIIGGAVPPGWRRLRFDRLVERSKECGRADWEPLSVFLGDGVVPRSSREDNHNRLGADMSNYLVVRPGDIVFNKLRTWQGGLGVSRYEGVVSPAYFVCRPREGIESRYYHYLLRSHLYLGELTRLSKFMPPSQFDISWDDLKTLPVLVPPLEEQRAIADYLDTETARIDALITKKRRMIELLDERRRAVVENLLTGHAAPWSRRRLRHICRQITVGVVVNPSSYFEAEGVPFVHGTDIKKGNIDTRNLKFLSAESNRLLRKSQVFTGDVVAMRVGEPGRAAVVTAELNGSNCASVLILRDGGVLLPGLLAEFLNSRSGRAQIEAVQYGAAQGVMNVSDAVDLLAPVPPAEEQRKIQDELRALSVRSAATELALARQLDLLAERRQALITAAVTGELATPGAAA